MKNLDVILVAGLVHYAPLYLATRALRSAGLRESPAVRFVQVGSDSQAIQTAVRLRDDPDSIPLLITSLSDIAIHEQKSQANQHGSYVLWFNLVERPFFSLACRKEDHQEILERIAGNTGSLRLACYRPGSTIRYLVEHSMRVHYPKGTLQFVDLDFPESGFDLVLRGEADLAVTIEPWLFEPTEKTANGRLLWNVPTRPSSFTCGLTHRKYFEAEESRLILERLAARVSEAVYLLYSSYDPLWRSDRARQWDPDVEEFDPQSVIGEAALVEMVSGLTFMKASPDEAPLLAQAPQFDPEGVMAALRWMASTQIWSFDAPELPRIERVPIPSGLVTAKELSAADREAGRIYGEVKPVLLELSARRKSLQEISSRLEYLENRLDPVRWSPGGKELKEIADILERDCFAVFHTPEGLKEPKDMWVLYKSILERIQGRDFFNAEVGFREECAKGSNSLPDAFSRACFQPLHLLPDIDDVRTPAQRALELVYFAKSLSKGMVPAAWLAAIVEHQSTEKIGEVGSLWRGFFDCRGQSIQVKLLRALHGLLSEVAVDSSGTRLTAPGQGSPWLLQITCVLVPNAVSGEAGLKSLAEAIEGIRLSSLKDWKEKNPEVQIGRTLAAAAALMEVGVFLRPQVVLNEGLTVAIDIPLSFRGRPSGNDWRTLLGDERS